MRRSTVEQAIIRELTVRGSCRVEDVVERLNGCTWNQVFSAIDRMTRDGTLALQRPARFEYHVSIIPGQHRPLEAGVTQ